MKLLQTDMPFGDLERRCLSHRWASCWASSEVPDSVMCGGESMRLPCSSCRSWPGRRRHIHHPITTLWIVKKKKKKSSYVVPFVGFHSSLPQKPRKTQNTYTCFSCVTVERVSGFTSVPTLLRVPKFFKHVFMFPLSFLIFLANKVLVRVSFNEFV